MEVILAMIAVSGLIGVMTYKLGTYDGYDRAYDDVFELFAEIRDEQFNNSKEVEEATERARLKDERLIGEGYAERQIADTLSKVEPINTKI